MMPADDAPVPPGLGAHLLEPGAGDVPVVAHVVVVPDHRVETVENSHRTNGSRQDSLVEPGVLLEVGHLLAGGLGGVAPRADPLAGLGRALVDVDLVAEQEEQLGPVSRSSRTICSCEHAERVDLVPSSSSSFVQRVGPLVRAARPGRSRSRCRAARRVEGADRARREARIRGRPPRSPSRRPRTRRSPPGSRPSMRTSA